MRQHGDGYIRDRSRAPGREQDRLLRAIEELRALERAKRREPVSSAPFHELQRRVDAKAREVFRIAGEVDDAIEADRDRRRTPH